MSGYGLVGGAKKGTKLTEEQKIARKIKTIQTNAIKQAWMDNYNDSQPEPITRKQAAAAYKAYKQSLRPGRRQGMTQEEKNRKKYDIDQIQNIKDFYQIANYSRAKLKKEPLADLDELANRMALVERDLDVMNTVHNNMYRVSRPLKIDQSIIDKRMAQRLKAFRPRIQSDEYNRLTARQRKSEKLKRQMALNMLNGIVPDMADGADMGYSGEPAYEQAPVMSYADPLLLTYNDPEEAQMRAQLQALARGRMSRRSRALGEMPDIVVKKRRGRPRKHLIV
jgi:hypothetical protein